MNQIKNNHKLKWSLSHGKISLIKLFNNEFICNNEDS